MARVSDLAAAVMMVVLLSACVVGESGPLGNPPADGGGSIALACGAPATDYKACVTADAKAGWCVPNTGCIETCSDVSTVCWTFSYAWPHDPEMLRDPICWCTDDNWLAPSDR